MTTVRDLLMTKISSIYYTNPFTTVRDALKMMAEKKVGALVVIQDGDIAGIFSERDFARKSITIPGFTMNAPIRSLMSSPVFYVLPDQSVEECMSLMTEKRIRHLPVMEENVLIGVISIGDVVRHLMVEKNAFIKNLESYIGKNTHLRPD
jgi:CBS domain-containing protein